MSQLGELAKVFFKLGCVSFGGPAAHIAMMREEVVEKRKWVEEDVFLDLMGATSLIPGPNSTQMTMHVGYLRGKVLGVLVAGFAFIFPAFLITLAFSWAYVEYGSMPAVEPYLMGIKPAVLALIFATLWKMGQKAVKGWELGVIGALVMGIWLAGLNEVLALLIGGVIGMICMKLKAKSKEKHQKPIAGGDTKAKGLLGGLLLGMSAKQAGAGALLASGSAAVATNATLVKLGVFFLKVAAVLYGSGYVLIAYIEGGLVEELAWLTEQQLMDSVAIGQMTPGPVLTTATVVGYQVLGWAGAIVATVAIFLPSFILVSLLNPVVPKLRKSPWASHFLDAINVCSVGLMAGVTGKLAVSTLISWQAWVIGIVAGVLALKYKVGAVKLVIGGAILGRILFAVAGS